MVDQNSDQPKKLAVREQALGDSDIYRHQTDIQTIALNLKKLANSFCGSQSNTFIDEFVKAYVHGGTVVNPRSAKRSQHEDIHSGGFLLANRASPRSATMPCDYIFATMPSFPWYTYPKKEALSMSFGEIYSDLYQQAERSGHAFTCRFTRSMLDPICTDPTDGWLPSQYLPSPTTLGDFLKLMGNRVPKASNATSPHVHITSDVQIMELESECLPDILIARLEACFEQSRTPWLESYTSGELPKLGKYPSHHWTCNHADAARCGWVPINPEYAAQVYDDGDHTRTRPDPRLEFEEGDCLVDISSLDETELEASMDEAGEYVPLFAQARRILVRMWFAYEGQSRPGAQQEEWADFKRSMQDLWSTPLLHTVLLLAGMVNCRIPLSAAAWVNKLFIPVYIRHNEDLLSVGLFAKHARQPKQQRKHPFRLLCVGQHLPSPHEKAFGNDLFLVDSETKVPVGLAPDMFHERYSDEASVRVVISLYNGYFTDLGDDKVDIGPRLLSDEPSVPREACVDNVQ